MRRMLVAIVFCVAVVVGMAGVAAAADYPPPVEPGGDVGGVTVSRSVGNATKGSSQLPFTGSDGTSTLVWVGGGLALAGGVIVVMSYRRRASLNA